MFNDNFKEVCKFCGGSGFRVTPIPLYDICAHCKGNKDLYWTENINGKPTSEKVNKEFLNKIVLRNIELLVSEIKHMIRKTGRDVIVTIEEVNYHAADPLSYAYDKMGPTILKM